ncbi:hypothetical protein [Pseudomonas sp. NPDC089406]|uniref:hypothetical protein n=1 Tax=Pseudomonas sp. NPDC089406 TaxID=3364463 RepID=UPI00384B34B9
MKKLLCRVGLALLLLVVLLFGSWLWVRQQATHAGREVASESSPGASCTLKTYVRNYDALGVPGRIVGLLSGSQYFYRVNDRQGEQLATSEWTIWQYEVGGDEAAHWIGSAALYPTTEGWAAWRLSQCNL